MNQKRDDYERAGVLEYLVLCVEEREVHWFHFPSRRVIRPDRKGVARSAFFPACGSTCLLWWSATGAGWWQPCTRGWPLPPTRLS